MFVFTTFTEPACEPEAPVWTVVLPPWPPKPLPLPPFETLPPEDAPAEVEDVTWAPFELLTLAELEWWCDEEPLTDEAFEFTTLREPASAPVLPVVTDALPPWPPKKPLLPPFETLPPEDALADVELVTLAQLLLLTEAAKAGVATENIASAVATAAAVPRFFFILFISLMVLSHRV